MDEVKPIREQISEKAFKPIALVDDVDNKVKGEFLDALRNRDMEYMLWSQRENPGFLEKIA